MRLINKVPGRLAGLALGLLPFLALILIYATASAIRRADNPDDKLLPSLAAMAASFARMAFEADPRSGDLLLWTDTAASLSRLGLGMGLSALLALCLGVLIGFIPLVRSSLAPFISALSLIPPITVLPILFILFGLGEAAKIMLIVAGTSLVMIRSAAQAVDEIPRELIVKAQTLGATTWQMIVRVVLPLMLPRLLLALRLGLVPAWIFLVSAEAIAATGGLGYRIFLVRRYLAMDVILPYVVWITLIAYLLDRALWLLSRRLFGWAHLEAGEP
jgi:NitT/TauT family transport system permease protein